MKKPNVLLLIALGFIITTVQSQNHLTEIEETGEMIVFNGLVYFAGDNGTQGSELWRSDGTKESTFILKDIKEGYLGSNPADFIVFNDELFFAANHPIYGREVWKTNGTKEGTLMAINLKPDNQSNNSSSPQQFTLCNNSIFFTAADEGTSLDLWKTDGTENGTIKVFDSESINVSDLITLNNSVYFIRYYGPRQLWKYDDVSGSAEMIFVDDNYFIENLNVFNNTVYFTTSQSGNEIRFYRLDSEDNPVLLQKYTGDIAIDNFIAVGNAVFYSLRTDYDYEDATDDLWKTDGTPEGTHRVKSFQFDPHSSGSYMGDFTDYNGKLYFRSSSSESKKIWVSDGSEIGTQQLADVFLRNDYGRLTVSGDKLYFGGCDGSSYWGDLELWVTNGTEEGTTIYANLNQVESSMPLNLYDADGLLYFTADDGSGRALWNNEACPEIKVKRGWYNIESEDYIHFSQIKVDSVEHQYLIIENTGHKELIISEIISKSSDFFINNRKNIIHPGETDSLTIAFFPESEGMKSGQIIIFNNDNNENSFILNLSGEAYGYVESPGLANDTIELTMEIIYDNQNDSLTISNSIIQENLPENSFIGSLEIHNGNSAEWDFTFTEGFGDADNPCFHIENNTVFSAKTFDYESRNTYLIRIKAQHKTNGSIVEDYFIIRIGNQNEPGSFSDCGYSLHNLCFEIADVEFIDEETVFAVGYLGNILKSTDAGNTWNMINSGTTASLIDIQFVSENTGYIAGSNRLVLKTENGGENWFPLEIPDHDYPYVDGLYFISEDTGFVFESDGELLTTLDGGKTWSDQTFSWINISAIFFTNDTTGFICGKYSGLFKTTDMGDTWITIDMDQFGSYKYFNDIHFTDEQTGYIICGEGNILKTQDGGENWTEIYKFTTDTYRQFYFVDENTAYVLGGSHKTMLFKTVDAGASWQEMIISWNSWPHAVSFSPSGQNGCIVGHGSGTGWINGGRSIFNSEDSGNTWSEICLFNGHDDFNNIAIFSDGTGYVSGEDLYKTSDKGLTFNEIIPPHYSCDRYYFIDKDTLFARNDSLYLSCDGGVSWTTIGENPTTNHRYFFLNSKIVFRYSMSEDYLYKSTNAGKTWNSIYTSNSIIFDVCFYNENNGYVLELGKSYSTADGGATWTEHDHNLDEFLTAVEFVDLNTIFIGTVNGLLLKSSDAGQTWTQIMTENILQLIDIEFYDSNHGLFVASNLTGHGALYETWDEGETWEYVRQINYNLQELYLSSDDEAYIVGSSGNSTIQKYAPDFPPSQAGYIYGPQHVCKGEIADYHTKSTAYQEYNWEISNGQSVSYADNLATVKWDETGEYTIEITPLNPCGTGLPQSLDIRVHPLPEPEILGNDSVLIDDMNEIYTAQDYSDDRIMWYTGGYDTAYIRNDREIFVSWNNTGSYIELLQTSQAGCRQKTRKEIFFVAGDNETMQDISINAYPVPASEYIYLNIPELLTPNCVVSIYDNHSSLIKMITDVGSFNKIDVRDLLPGMYLLRIQGKNLDQALKIIKK